MSRAYSLRAGILTLSLLFFSFLFPVSSALANTGRVLSTAAVVIHRHELVQDVMVIGNNAVVAGDVYEALIVLDGDIRLMPTARVGVLIDLGGSVIQDPGAHVNAEYVFTADSSIKNYLLFGVGLMAMFWFAQVVVSTVLLVLPMLLTLFFSRWFERPANLIVHSLRRASMAGFISTAAIIAVSGALALTVIGIPISLILIGIELVAGIIGWTAVSLWMGRIISNAFALNGYPQWLISGIGSGLIMALVNIPIAGVIFFVLFWFAGAGSVTISLWQWLQRRKVPGN